MKWNEWGFRPPLCIHRLNWAGRTSWGWWDEWDDTALQTQNSKFKPWRSEAEHATSRSQRLPTIFNLYEWAGKKYFLFFETWILERGSKPRPPTFQAGSFSSKHETLSECCFNVSPSYILHHTYCSCKWPVHFNLLCENWQQYVTDIRYHYCARKSGKSILFFQK